MRRTKGKSESSQTINLSHNTIYTTSNNNNQVNLEHSIFSLKITVKPKNLKFQKSKNQKTCSLNEMVNETD